MSENKLRFEGSLCVEELRDGDGEEVLLAIQADDGPGLLIAWDGGSIWIAPATAPAFAAILLNAAQNVITELVERSE